jgi:hypothetical protein
MTTESKTKVCLLFADYKKDPNCWPELWIADEQVTEEEKKLFLSLVKDDKDFSRFLDTLETLHP